MIKNQLTIVTALYDLGRGDISDSFKRSYQHYLDRFVELRESISHPLVVFCSKTDLPFFKQHSNPDNTFFVVKELEEFRTWFEPFAKVQEIRNRVSWKNQAGWLLESPQSTLEFYNPLVMSKMFLVNDVTLMNPFHSEYFLWLDAGLTSTVHKGYFSHDKVLEKVIPSLDPFLFLSYPYEGSSEIHGFERDALHSYAKTDYVKYVCRGGLFGGRKTAINRLSGMYYHLLQKTLADGFMGTEESLFTILAHLYPHLINRFMLQSHGMIANFCEALKTDSVVYEFAEKETPKFIPNKPKKNPKTSIYVLTYNFPQQFQSVLDSFVDQPEFLTETRRICVDNSTSQDAKTEIESICNRYGFEYIHPGDNLGICGGRKFVADHFKNSSQKYYIFFEDDMLMVRKGSLPCRNGFITHVPGLFKKIHQIMDKEHFDFLKLTFTEFYMDNSIAVPWYNVPQHVREELYPEQPQKLDNVKVPSTLFKHISCEGGLSYITGDIFYCNWPLLISQEGNRKIFFEPEYAYPFEQTIMSHAIQETKKGNIKAGCLLASTIEHERIYHYDGSERKEC